MISHQVIGMEASVKKPMDVKYPRPRAGTRTGRVWEIADERTREIGYRAKRADVIQCCVAEGINRNTASTQYQHWRADFEASHRRAGEAEGRGPLPQVGPRQLGVTADGRILLPHDVRRAMRLDGAGTVIARVEAGELRLLSPAVALARMQARFRKYAKPGESVVDRFLADRPAMWGDGPAVEIEDRSGGQGERPGRGLRPDPVREEEPRGGDDA